MDKDGNLSQIEKEKLATLLLLIKKWWQEPTSRSDTLSLIECFLDFRKELGA